MTNGLCKEERLHGKRVIANLFAHGRSFFLPPFKVFWIQIPEINSFPTGFAISVPKRRFKRAVKRNLIKRRTREAFRTNKQILNATVTDGSQIHLMLIYVSDRLLPFVELNDAMKKIVQRIARQHVESV